MFIKLLVSIFLPVVHRARVIHVMIEVLLYVYMYVYLSAWMDVYNNCNILKSYYGKLVVKMLQ